MPQQFDYIIAGAGAAGLSLAWHLLQSPLRDKKILVVDSELAITNDKTWCFWDNATPPFDDIIHKKWERIEVSTFGDRFTQHLNDYPYYCLQSRDFKEKILSALKNTDNVTLKEASITELHSTKGGAELKTENRSYQANYIFQSCFRPSSTEATTPHHPLIQHFLGWEIESQSPVFDASVVTLMDFDDTFSQGIAFIYLLPWTDYSGLIEYTVFSDDPLPKNEYEEKLSLYLNNRFGLQPIDYRVQRKEFGKIPMQDRPYIPWYAPNILNIGTVGGCTKPSTGYTFRRIQKQVKAVVSDLIAYGKPQKTPASQQRFKAYDLWLLQIIDDHPKDARAIFNHLFHNNSIDDVFRFLAEESSFSQDLQIMTSVPYRPFLRAIWQTKRRLLQL